MNSTPICHDVLSPAFQDSDSMFADSMFAADFDGDKLSDLRQVITRCAADSGLTGPRLHDFVIAVNELLSNAVRYAGGRGQVRLWTLYGRLHCAVVDRGPGIPAPDLARQEAPPMLGTGGRGLWLARQLCDDVTIVTGPHGTTVHAVMAIHDSRS